MTAIIATSLTTEELYRLNDQLTAALSNLQWNADTEEDYDNLNDVVLHIASTFFPAPKGQA